MDIKHTKNQNDNVMYTLQGPLESPYLKLCWRATDPNAMTARQEVANAVTMLAPSACYVCMLCLHRVDPQSVDAQPSTALLMLTLATVMHLPLSFAYHMGMAMNRYDDRLDNDVRRLDQTYIHLAASVYACALSSSAAFMACACCVNLISIVFVWRAETSNDGKRWVPALVSSLLPTAPVLQRGEARNFLLASAGILLGGLPFVPRINQHVFKGWGHALFHVNLSAYAYGLGSSALALQPL